MEHFEINDGMEAAHKAATPEQRAATRDELARAANALVEAAKHIVGFSPARGDDPLVAALLEMQDFILKAAILYDFESVAEARESCVLDHVDMTPASAIDCSAA